MLMLMLIPLLKMLLSSNIENWSGLITLDWFAVDTDDNSVCLIDDKAIGVNDDKDLSISTDEEIILSSDTLEVKFYSKHSTSFN